MSTSFGQQPVNVNCNKCRATVTTMTDSETASSGKIIACKYHLIKTGKSKFSCRAILVRPLSLKPPQNLANLLLFTVELPTFLNFQKQTDARLSLIKILNPPVPTPKTGVLTKDKIGHIFRKKKHFQSQKFH